DHPAPTWIEVLLEYLPLFAGGAEILPVSGGLIGIEQKVQRPTNVADVVRVRGRAQVGHGVAAQGPYLAGPPVAREHVVVEDAADPDVAEIPEAELVSSSHFERGHVLVLALLVAAVITTRVADAVRPDLAGAHVRRPRVRLHVRV